jgi:hypothetical protein
MRQKPPGPYPAHNAGWQSQFRFAVHGFWTGVYSLCRLSPV